MKLTNQQTGGRHSKKDSGDLTRQIRADLSLLWKQHQMKTEHVFDPLRVRIIKGHHNWIAVAYAYAVCCYRYVHIHMCLKCFSVRNTLNGLFLKAIIL